MTLLGFSSSLKYCDYFKVNQSSHVHLVWLCKHDTVCGHDHLICKPFKEEKVETKQTMKQWRTIGNHP